MHILNDVNMRKRLERVGESTGDREDAFVNTSFNGLQNPLDRYIPVAVVRAHVLKVRSALVDGVASDGTFSLSKHWSARIIMLN